MNTFKTFLVWILAGALLGAIAASFLGPGMVTYYNSSSDAHAMCECTQLSRSTAADLIRIQAIGAALGAVLFLVLGLLIRRRAHPHAATGGAPGAALPPSGSGPGPRGQAA